MDALEFVRETNRMCKSFDDNCEDCPASDVNGCMVDQLYEEIVPIVEKWSKENPRNKTRQDVFLEQYPEAPVTSSGVLAPCPAIVSADYRREDGRCAFDTRCCTDCCREFWMQEVD